jgi:hypothetical protein
MTEKKPPEPVRLSELQALHGRKIGLLIHGAGNYKEVTVERRYMKTSEWRKLILRMKASGFDHDPGQSEWFGSLTRSEKHWRTWNGLIRA